MALARIDIEIDKGFVWEALLIFPGNRFMSAEFKGQMRLTALDPVVLANFKFDFPRYKADEKRTELRAYLPKMATLTLPATSSALWFYDVRASLIDNTSHLVLAGRARVWETVTEG